MTNPKTPAPPARLFEFDGLGQVLLFKTTDEKSNPAIVFMASGVGGLEPKVVMAYDNDEERDARFERASEFVSIFRDIAGGS